MLVEYGDQALLFGGHFVLRRRQMFLQLEAKLSLASSNGFAGIARLDRKLLISSELSGTAPNPVDVAGELHFSRMFGSGQQEVCSWDRGDEDAQFK